MSTIEESPILKIFEILEYYYPVFIAKIETLNRKALKLNLPGILVDTLETYQKKFRIWLESGNYQDYQSKVFKVSISGVIPHISGFKFIAKIEETEEGNIISSINGENLPEIYRTMKPECEHCHKNRVRNYYYVIQNVETLEYKMVGKTCLMDFTGNKDIESIALFYSEISNLTGKEEEEEDFDTSIKCGRYQFPVIDYIVSTIRSVKLYGWVSSNQYSDKLIPTKYTALDIMLDRKPSFTEEEIEEGKKVIEEVSRILDGKKTLSDYENNIVILIKNEFTHYQNIGYLASIYPLYLREIEHEIKVKLTRENSKSIWLGEEGKHLENLSVKVISEKILEGIYGKTYLYSFLDDNGNKISWFSSSNQYLKPEEEVKIIKCMVKKHNDFNGEKQTVITRAKIGK